MCNFEFFGILDFPRLIQLINQYSKRYRFVVEGRIKKVMQEFFSCRSDDVVCKVLCQLVEKCGRSSEKTVQRFSRFSEKYLSTQMGVAYAKRCSRLQCICVYKFLDSGRFGVGVIAPNVFSLEQRHLVTGVSGFCRLRSPKRPGSSHAIGVSAPFTVWAVVPHLAQE